MWFISPQKPADWTARYLVSGVFSLPVGTLVWLTDITTWGGCVGVLWAVFFVSLGASSTEDL